MRHDPDELGEFRIQFLLFIDEVDLLCYAASWVSYDQVWVGRIFSTDSEVIMPWIRHVFVSQFYLKMSKGEGVG